MKIQTSKAFVFIVFLFPIMSLCIPFMITCRVLGLMLVIEELRLDNIPARSLMEVYAICVFLSSLIPVVTILHEKYSIWYYSSNICPLSLLKLAGIILYLYCMCQELLFLSIAVRMPERNLANSLQLHC